MCGRYAASRSPDDLVEEFEVERVEVREQLEPDYNVAPTKTVYAVLTRRSLELPEGSPAVRQLRVVTWGLVPSWAKDPSIGSRLINARMETLTEKPAFRRAFAKRRCLLPADGYYEWYAGSAPGAAKQPFYIHPTDGGSLAMAGLYEFWRSEHADPDDPASWRWTATVITTQAEDALGQIHDRMPLMVARDRWAHWLDPATCEPDELRGLLVPAAPGLLRADPVSTAVNNVRNNGPELVEPVAPSADETLF